MKRLQILFAMLLGLATSAWGAYTYYFTDTDMSSFTWSNWSVSGTLTTQYASAGFWGLGPSSGYSSMLSNLAVPDSSSDYVVRMKVRSGSGYSSAIVGGYAAILLRASNDATVQDTNVGTYYSFWVSDSGFYFIKRVGGVLTFSSWNSFGGGTIPDGAVIKAYAYGNKLSLQVEGFYGPTVITDSSISSGKAGVGITSWDAKITELYLGPIDRTNPNPITSGSIGTSSFSNRVDIQWSGISDDTNGVGLSSVTVSRGGSQIGSLYPSAANSFSDTTVAASTSYSYSITATDFHGNSSSTTIGVTTPPTGSVDPRRVGLRNNGAYWGAKGEQIDLLSGNLNYTIPLLAARARGGWAVPFNLTYNSQNWRQDPGGIWKMGDDVGYGFGWKLLAGSITPHWTNYWTLDHYTFTDATGAEYRLDTNNSGIWSSSQGVFIYYNANTDRLYFPDGSYWNMYAVSAADEGDAGTRYPTWIMDSNGNYISISYAPGLNMGSTANTSSRIDKIWDVRAGGSPTYTPTFTFNYTSGYLTSITNSISTGEAYTFSYSSAQSLVSPFSGATFGTVKMLQSITATATSLATSFTTDTAGTLTKVTFPYGGHIRWAHANYTYLGTRLQPEVQNRYLSANGSTESTFPISRDSSDTGRTVHNYAVITDPSSSGDKRWFFNTNAANSNIGLLSYREDREGSTVKVRTDYTWTTSGSGPLLASLKTTADPGGSQIEKTHAWTYTSTGNLSDFKIYQFNSTSTIARQFQYTYLTDSNYTSRYILNRRLTSSVAGTVNGSWVSPVTVAQVAYDASGCSGYTSLADVTGATYHDGTNYGTSFNYRGNPTYAVGLHTSSCAAYDILGNSPTQLDTQGRVHNTTFGYNYTVPTATSMGVYSESAEFNSFLGLTEQTGLNGTAELEYDSAARPTETTSPLGVVTTYTYTSSPPTVKATTNGRWTKTTFDGLGRTIKVENGDSSSSTVAKTLVETEYTTAGLSPLGVVYRTSIPRSPGATARWTTHTYDGIGRTTSVQSYGGTSTSTTSYSYLANTVTTTDAASKWKTMTMDELGNISKVTEPNPAGGNWDTNYKYTLLGQVSEVSQTRASTTQTRSFTYTGALLTSSTTPEHGTVSYTYDAYARPKTKTDAKSMVTTLTYDSLGRVTKKAVTGTGYQDCQDVDYYWDSYFVSTPPTGQDNTAGRLAAMKYRACGTETSGAYSTSRRMEFFSYTANGQLKFKDFYRGTIPDYSSLTYGRDATKSLRADLTYDSEGRIATLHYPDTTTTGPTYTYTYDSVTGRSTGMNQGGTAIVSNLTYGSIGELLTMTYGGNVEEHSYNDLYQLTRLKYTPTGGGSAVADFEYTFPTSTNNGKISKMKDWVTGEEVNYTYDALNRLLTAETTGAGWGQAYVFDGFNNLLQQNVIKGTAPGPTFSVDPATNQLTTTTYDANGNDLGFGTYDRLNRLKTASSAYYDYDPGNKRIWKRKPDSSEEFYFYLGNQRLGTYTYASGAFSTSSTNLYFGGKMISAQGSTILTDRLGSNVAAGKRYFPFGQEKPSATTNNTEKFTGYFRDAESGLDYADQRYHNPGSGRFITPDPIGAGSNWYSYVNGDPVNKVDPSGLIETCYWVMGVFEGCEDDGNHWYCDNMVMMGSCPLLPVQIWCQVAGKMTSEAYCRWLTGDVPPPPSTDPPTTTTTATTTPATTTITVETTPAVVSVPLVNGVDTNGQQVANFMASLGIYGPPSPAQVQAAQCNGPCIPGSAQAIFTGVAYAFDSISYQVSVTVGWPYTFTATANTRSGESYSGGATIGNSGYNYTPRISDSGNVSPAQFTLPVPSPAPPGYGATVNWTCGVIGPSIGIPGLISVSGAVNFGGCNQTQK